MVSSQLYRELCARLRCENAEFEAMQLLLHATGKTTAGYLAARSEPVSEQCADRCYQLVSRRNAGEPLYYIIGECEFYSLPFYVGRGVLIPRQDTETLVDEALRLIDERGFTRLCDLCSGSGCVATAIAKNRPQCSVDAVELYPEALGYLRRNIERNAAANVTPVQADALVYRGDYQLVVCNPPYIAPSERGGLQRELDFEPPTALYAQDDGLLFYRRISENFAGSGTALAFEIGSTQSAAVERLLRENGYKNPQTIKDMCGNPRVVVAIGK